MTGKHEFRPVNPGSVTCATCGESKGSRGHFPRPPKGSTVRFVNPDTDQTIEGVVDGYKRDGRMRIEEHTGMTRTERPRDKDGKHTGTDYVFTSHLWTVPKHVDVEVVHRVSRPGRAVK